MATSKRQLRHSTRNFSLCDLYRAKVKDVYLSCWVLTGRWPMVNGDVVTVGGRFAGKSWWQEAFRKSAS